MVNEIPSTFSLKDQMYTFSWMQANKQKIGRYESSVWTAKY